MISSSSVHFDSAAPLDQQTHRKDPGAPAPLKGKQDNQPAVISSGSSLPPGIHGFPKKPMRPLTAYHIFFQIEREYIIQTIQGEDEDVSIHDNKVHLDDVPRRYRGTRLLPDWYAGPGKRPKRKHRRQHGKIGFLELSRVISERWARLENVDPETKRFVQRIARRELDDYYREMKEYKDITKDLPRIRAEKPAQHLNAPRKKASDQGGGSSNSSLPAIRPTKTQPPVVLCPDMVSSLRQPANTFVPIQLENDIDHFLSYIDNNMQHPLPQPESFGTANMSQVQAKNVYQRQGSDLPLSYFNSISDKPSKNQRMGTKPSPCASPKSVEVDIGDDEILQLWKAHN